MIDELNKQYKEAIGNPSVRTQSVSEEAILSAQLKKMAIEKEKADSVAESWRYGSIPIGSLYCIIA